MVSFIDGLFLLNDIDKLLLALVDKAVAVVDVIEDAETLDNGVGDLGAAGWAPDWVWGVWVFRKRVIGIELPNRALKNEYFVFKAVTIVSDLFELLQDLLLTTVGLVVLLD